MAVRPPYRRWAHLSCCLACRVTLGAGGDSGSATVGRRECTTVGSTHTFAPEVVRGSPLPAAGSASRPGRRRRRPDPIGRAPARQGAPSRARRAAPAAIADGRTSSSLQLSSGSDRTTRHAVFLGLAIPDRRASRVPIVPPYAGGADGIPAQACSFSLPDSVAAALHSPWSTGRCRLRLPHW